MAKVGRKAASGNALVNSLIDGGYYWTDGDSDGVTRIRILYEGNKHFEDIPFTYKWEDKAIKSALQAWEDVAAIRFESVPVKRRADMVIEVTTPIDDPELESDDSIIYGYMEGPSDLGRNGRSDGALNYFVDSWDKTGAKPGGYAHFTIMHELGHGLGLAHPFDEGQSGKAELAYTNTLLTTMEYLDYRLGSDGYASAVKGNDAPYSYRSKNPATPGPLDIAAIQHLYGANLNADDGDGDGSANDVYRLPTSNSSETNWRTLWDTGGVDWIINPSQLQSWIDLRPAIFPRSASDDDDQFLNGGFGQVKDVRGGFLIPDDFTGALDTASGPNPFRGVLIENARGGSGDDRIDGNASSNKLFGKGGDDRIAGYGGDDVLKGGGGTDQLNGGAGRDVMTGGDGFDRFVVAKEWHSRSKAGARDKIKDFQDDKREDIDFSRIDANPYKRGDQEFAFIAKQRFDGGGEESAGQLRYYTLSKGKHVVAADIDGDGSADVGLVVLGVTALQANDFIL